MANMTRGPHGPPIPPDTKNASTAPTIKTAATTISANAATNKKKRRVVDMAQSTTRSKRFVMIASVLRKIG